MANYGQSSEWQPSPPWKESPLDSFQHLRGLMQSPPDAFKEELSHSLPHVQTLVNNVVDHIMEEAQTLSRALGKVYAEYRYDYGNHREYVRILEVHRSTVLRQQRLQRSERHPRRSILRMAQDDQY